MTLHLREDTPLDPAKITALVAQDAKARRSSRRTCASRAASTTAAARSAGPADGGRRRRARSGDDARRRSQAHRARLTPTKSEPRGRRARRASAARATYAFVAEELRPRADDAAKPVPEVREREEPVVHDFHPRFLRSELHELAPIPPGRCARRACCTGRGRSTASAPACLGACAPASPSIVPWTRSPTSAPDGELVLRREPQAGRTRRSARRRARLAATRRRRR